MRHLSELCGEGSGGSDGGGVGEGEGGEARFVSCSMYVRSSPF